MAKCRIGSMFQSRLLKILLCLVLLPYANVSFAETQRLPAMDAKTLSGEKITLPGGYDGKPVVLVFGFARAARTESETWGKELINLEQKHANFRFFQVAMLSGAPRFTHGLITKALRASVPSTYYDHMLLVTDNANKWRDVLDVTDDGSAYVVLCSPRGEIQWQAKGAGPAQMDALRARLGKSNR